MARDQTERRVAVYFSPPIAESEEIIATLATSQERREESGIVWYAAAMQIRREASTNTSYLCHFSLSFPHCTVPFLTSHLSASLFALSSAQEKKKKNVARARDRIGTVNLTCSHFKCSSRELHPSGRPTNCWLTPTCPCRDANEGEGVGGWVKKRLMVASLINAHTRSWQTQRCV